MGGVEEGVRVAGVKVMTRDIARGVTASVMTVGTVNRTSTAAAGRQR